MSRTAFIAVMALAMLATFHLPDSMSSENACKTGEIQGYALITGSRIGGPGAIPSKFTAAQRYFGRRLNCTRRLVAVRRVDEGHYLVRFPGNRAVVALVSAFNMDGTASSVAGEGRGIFHVRLLGPRIDSNVLEPRDTPFVIVLV